ncbi:serine/threonine-protein kinase ULK3 isoform X2 [Drosophila nasuta]|uniref:Serine/threonine-protein kinase ULK3 n=1 Tax=Drosophila albomicans TaxID=7291 RepID=A0A6P8XZY8_DROAB|nr:serine/threonine-protein kinase ULK3 isoform X3 [Drosophila albomicans]XP_060647263.1 serine/threonine-protein kinase ULK3 isoform X2 [Drosophila nasuta]
MALPRITDYEILEKLGAGSYATVYKARHKKQRTYHAIKYVEMSSLSQSSRDNLITEIRLLRDLKHKYIVTLQDFFWDDKNIYILLEYCNAGNLSAFIRTKKALPESTCRYFLRQLAAAVQYLRANDISHFDLKPQNLLLTRGTNNVSLKVADFGALQYFVPLITEESDATRRQALRNRALAYMKRAEEIKNVIIEDEYKLLAQRNGRITTALPYLTPSRAETGHEDGSATESSQTSSSRIIEMFEPDVRYKQLFALSNSSPSLKSGLEIGRQGELYLYERKLDAALESYTSALGILVPFVNKEPKGERRNLLLQQLEFWIKEAESIKSILSAKNLDEEEQKLSTVSSQNHIPKLPFSRLHLHIRPHIYLFLCIVFGSIQSA